MKEPLAKQEPSAQQEPLLKKRWLEWQLKIDGLKMRERALVLFTALAVVYLLWDMIVFSPLAEANASLNKQVSAVEKKIHAMEQEQQAILLAVNADPDRDLKQRIDDLSQQLSELDHSLAELSLGLVPVDQLAKILHDVLLNTDELELQHLRTLPVEEIFLSSSPSPDDGAVGDGTGVYKHRVAVTVKGGFHQLMAYLTRLEQMNWRFYWDELQFVKDRYPNAVIELRVYTLSTDEGLFGV